MPAEQGLTFEGYRLDLTQAQLWRGKRAIELPKQTLAVLCYLVEHAGQLVTKAELFAQLWPGVAVSDGALTYCIVELRKALGDNARQPKFIETVHRRGYRFLAKVVSQEDHEQGAGSNEQGAKRERRSPAPSPQPLAPVLVGREADLAHLHDLFAKAMSGTRQIVFVTGEPGIGKTTLVDTFLVGVQGRMPSHEKTRQSSSSVSEGAKIAAALSSTFSPQSSSEPRALTSDPWLARGQCIEHYGRGEAYLPVLDALGQFARGAERNHLRDVLHAVAPLWLLQFPMLLDGVDVPALHAKVMGATPERMLREFADAVELLTHEQPLILILEDLHWSDHATVELLAFISRRQIPARLMLIGTYRPVELLSTSHPLTSALQEISAHALCTELTLVPLTEADINVYLSQRFPASILPTRLVQVLHQHTGGNPLFLVSVIQDLIIHGQLQKEDGQWRWHGEIDAIAQQVPVGLRQLVARQRERLQPEAQQLLEAASVAGYEFAAATVAAALERPLSEMETRCHTLVERQQFIQPIGISEWPDGTVSARYRFQHALYQQLWHERTQVSSRREWHLRIGDRLEVAYNGRASEIATELAVHFEQGGNYRKAVQYLEHAGQHASQRSAYVEAISHFTKGLEVLKNLPDTPDHVWQELTLQSALGMPLMATKGYASPEVKTVYDRARSLCRQVGESLQLFPVLLGLTRFYITQPDFLTAAELGEDLLRIAHRAQDARLLLGAQMIMATNCFFQGKFAQVQEYTEQVLSLYDPQQHRELMFEYGEDPKLHCSCWSALTLWILGYPDQAREHISQALRFAQELAHPYELTFTLFWAAFLHYCCGEVQGAQAQLAVLLPLTQKHGILPTATLGVGLRGWILSEQGQREEGIAQIQQSLTRLQSIGLGMGQLYCLTLLAETYSKGGCVAEGLEALTEALDIVHKGGNWAFQAELYRIKGKLALQQESQKHGTGRNRGKKVKVTSGEQNAQTFDPRFEAETCFHQAIAIARKQRAKLLELRAATSLTHLWRQQGKRHEAHALLSEVYNWFTEGFDTKDLQEARALLEALNHEGMSGSKRGKRAFVAKH